MFELGLHNPVDVIRGGHPSGDHLIIAKSTSTDAAKIDVATSHTISSLENLKFGLTVEIYLVPVIYHRLENFGVEIISGLRTRLKVLGSWSCRV